MSILAARSRSYLSYERTTAIGFPFLRTNAVLSFLERSRINFAEISLKSPILWGFSGKVKDHYFDTLGIKITVFIWWTWRDSNSRPLGCEPNALPTELQAQPLLRYQRKHDFQSCAFVHSATSPHKQASPNVSLRRRYCRCNVDYYTILFKFVKRKIAIFRFIFLYTTRDRRSFRCCEPALW